MRLLRVTLLLTSLVSIAFLSGCGSKGDGVQRSSNPNANQASHDKAHNAMKDAEQSLPK